jgi:hypothetical protein
MTGDSVRRRAHLPVVEAWSRAKSIDEPVRERHAVARVTVRYSKRYLRAEAAERKNI